MNRFLVTRWLDQIISIITGAIQTIGDTLIWRAALQKEAIIVKEATAIKRDTTLVKRANTIRRATKMKETTIINGRREC